jgi:hypothetical protein
LILVDLFSSVPDVIVASSDKLCKVIFHDNITHIIPQFIILHHFAEFDLSSPLCLAETVLDWADIRRRPRADIRRRSRADVRRRSRADICRRPRADICRRPRADICRRPTADICRRPTADICRRPRHDINFMIFRP